MLKNYIKIAVRNLARHKLYTAINIVGLALGLAICLVVVGHLSHEVTFEDMHVNKDRIYRVETTERFQGDTRIFGASVAPFGEAIAQEIPEVESAAIFRVNYDVAATVDKKHYRAANLIFANPEYLDVFTFPMLRGNPETALQQPMSVLVTEETIDKYFSGFDPVGRKITIDNRYEFTVTGVLEDIPATTQLDCEFIASHSSLTRSGEVVNSWETYSTDYIYVLLRRGADPVAVESKLQPIIERNIPADKTEADYYAALMPLGDIYFGSFSRPIYDELEPRGEASFIYELGFVAAFVLIIAIVNFINLSTARTADRRKEVGMRKVFGAARRNLIGQFLGESVFVTAAATILGVIFYEIFKAQLHDFLPRPMFVDFYESALMIALTLGLLLAVSVLAGFYPALYLSRFRPVSVLQGKSSIKSTRSVMRKVLVVFQFAVAIVFVICAVIMSRQVNYISTMNLGFDQNNILLLDFEGEDASDNCALVKSEVLSSGGAVAATVVNRPPGRKQYTYHRCVSENNDTLVVTMYKTDETFLNTFDISVNQGQTLSPEMATETMTPILVTSSVAKRITGNPLGQKLMRSSGHYEIVGVVDDFYGGPIDISVDGALCIVVLDPDAAKTLAIKLPGGDVTESVAAVKKVWERVMPGVLFDYSFVEDEVDRGLSDQRGVRFLFLLLAAFSIIIASMGIIGLVSFTAEQRTKEIGVRKVLGASVGAIVALLSREFVIVIVIANVLAAPIAYLFMNMILQQHSVRISIGPGTFLLAGFISIFIAILTAGSQAFRAATADPTETLRRE